MNYSFLKLAEDVLMDKKIPLSIYEIWKMADELGLVEKLNSKGKTPTKSLASQIYVDVKTKQNNSKFIKVTKGANTKFGLKVLEANYSNAELESIPIETTDQKENFKERDLHPLLTKFVVGNQHFGCYTKTIHHEKSKKSSRKKNEWLHPDLVGVHYSFEDYHERTMDLINCTMGQTCKIYSFEMKIKLTLENLRQYYFQAVSNSSWAHEGYLVVLDFDDDNQNLLDEMRRLNNAFGIGLIVLNAENIEESEIKFTARLNNNLDMDTVDRLVSENTDFQEFTKSVAQDIQVKEVRGSFDRILNEEGEYKQYLIDKKIKNTYSN